MAKKMNMRRPIRRRPALAFLSGLAVSAAVPRSLHAKDVIKIGAVFPLNGPNSVFGNQSLQDALVAVDLINDRRGINGRHVAMLIADGHSPQNPISEMNRLISREGVSIFVGSSTSATGMVASSKCARSDAD